jgi:hypothetical protein
MGDESKDQPFWQMTDHCCRACFGRVLYRETFDHRHVYRCAQCGVEREGKGTVSICCCGIKLKGGKDAGVRCTVNGERSPEFPSEIIAEQAQAV